MLSYRFLLLSFFVLFTNITLAADSDQFIKDARRGNIESLTQYVSSKGDINAKNSSGMTALLSAVKYNKLEAVVYLLENGADTKAADKDGKTALHYAADKGKIEIVKKLVETGTPIDHKDNEGKTPLILAFIEGKQDCFEYLLSKGADINSRIYGESEGGYDSNGQTLLHKVILFGNGKMVKYLVEKGANLEERNSEGQTPLHFACSVAEPDIDIITYLLEKGAYVNAQDVSYVTPMKYAQSRNLTGIVNLLKEHGGYTDSPQKPDINFWLESKSADGVEKYLNSGGDINKKDKNGRTLLHCLACDNRSIDSSILKNIFKGKPEVNVADIDGTTPLHWACQYKHRELVEYLLANGANASAYDKNYELPIHLLVYNVGRFIDSNFSMQNEYDILEMLLEAGVDINLPNSSEQTVLHILGNSEPRIIPFIRYVVEKGGDVNKVNVEGNTMLHVAVEDGNVELVKYLLERGANTNIKNCYGYTPRRIAEQYGNDKILKIFDASGSVNIFTSAQYGLIDKVKEALDSGVDINTPNEKGYSALTIAAYMGQSEMVDFLIRSGADVNFAGNSNLTPLYFAITSDNKTAKLLIDNGARLDIVSNDGINLLGLCCYNDKVILKDIIKKQIDLKPLYKSIDKESDIRKLARDDYRKQCYQENDRMGAAQRLTLESHSPLHSTVINNDYDGLKRQLSIGGDVNALDAMKHTALWYAIFLDNEKMVEYLIKHGANIKLIDQQSGDTAMHTAASYNRVEILKLLLANGGDVHIKNNAGYSPLDSSISFRGHDALRELIAAGADVNEPCETGETAIFQAVKQLEFDKVAILLKNGADINHINEKGYNPFSYLLFAKTDLSDKDYEMLDYLIESGIALNVKNSMGRTLLQTAVEKNELKLAKTLINGGADVNSKDINGETAMFLHLNPWYNRGKDAREIIELLLDNGADLNVKSKSGNVLLHNVVRLNSSYYLEKLISRGADIEITDSDQNTALHIAAKERMPEMVKILLSHKANKNAVNKKGLKPVDLAMKRDDEKSKEIVELLK